MPAKRGKTIKAVFPLFFRLRFARFFPARHQSPEPHDFLLGNNPVASERTNRDTRQPATNPFVYPTTATPLEADGCASLCNCSERITSASTSEAPPVTNFDCRQERQIEKSESLAQLVFCTFSAQKKNPGTLCPSERFAAMVGKTAGKKG